MLDKKIFQFKPELRKMVKGSLLKMAFSQKERNCLLGGVCPFLLEYRSILFCVSEILGHECQIENQRLLTNQDAQSEAESSQKPGELPVGPWLPGFC
jgi:hypothetical protein